MKVGYFTSEEFASRDGAKSPFGPMNVEDSLISLLNSIRVEFGKPIVVNCGYRSPTHNKAVGGVENSFHTKGVAADIRPSKAEDLPLLQGICLGMNQRGGVGLYDTFVHVDARGTRARWDERHANEA